MISSETIMPVETLTQSITGIQNPEYRIQNGMCRVYAEF
jgi:hypothetical protein